MWSQDRPDRDRRESSSKSPRGGRPPRGKVVPVAELLESRVLLYGVPGASSPDVVTSLADSGPGTLRDVLARASAAGATETILFAPGLTGTINLNTPLSIQNESISIQGPGPRTLSISNVVNNTGDFDVTGTGLLSLVSGLTLVDSNSASPGAITAEATTGGSTHQLALTNDVFETTGTGTASFNASVWVKTGSTYGDVQITGDTFLGNSTQATMIGTYGIDLGGATLEVQGSTFEGFAKGISLLGTAGAAQVVDSTFTGDYGTSGAAIDDLSGAGLSLFDDTIAGNKAVNSVVRVDTGGRFEGTILYGNTYTNGLVEGYSQSLGFNDFQNPTAVTPGLVGGLKSTDVSVDPLLTALGDFGGAAPTFGLRPGSPVLAAGAPGLVGTDERGTARSSSAPSIGAFEGSGVLFTVNTVDDNGGVDPAADAGTANLAGTFRQAVVDSRHDNAGTFAIQFAIPGNSGNTHTIMVLADYDNLVNPVVIDGTTQAGYAGSPLIHLLGKGADTGLTLDPTTGRDIIRGLSLSGFTGDGIDILSNVHPVAIVGDVIGVDPNFYSTPANGNDGISVLGLSSAVTIGGTTWDDRDVISGNANDGIYIGPTATGTLVEGDAFGTTASGLAIASAGNSDNDISVAGNNNTIGGTTLGAVNVLAPAGTGIAVQGTGNVVAGNSIGLAIDGTTALNDGSGIGMEIDGPNNAIGLAGAGNAIENMNLDALDVFGANESILGNLIEFNGGTGVYQGGNAATIGGPAAGAGNLIANNVGGGVDLEGSSSSVVQGNVIGLDLAGNASAVGVDFGVNLIFGASNNTIGGAGTGQGNVISGNRRGVGVVLDNGSASNLIQGNIIGLDPTASYPVGNQDGLIIANGSSGNTVRGNSIGGNADDGVRVLATYQSTGASGPTQNNLVVGNTIQFNNNLGVQINAPTTTLQANRILSNSSTGVLVTSGTDLIGGGNAIQGNAIFNNAAGTGADLQLDGAGATGDTVRGNFVGYDPTNPAGYTAPTLAGIELSGGATANTIQGNTLDKITNGSALLLTGAATSGNTVAGNFIGTDPTGAAAIGYNEVGLEVDLGASANTISGDVISDNTAQGVYIHDAGTAGNIVSGDFIGTNLGGTFGGASHTLSNNVGLQIGGGATGTVVSGSVISGSLADNVLIAGATTTGNVLHDDKVGTNAAGTAAIDLPPFLAVEGIVLAGSVGNTIGPNDVVSGNLGDGIELTAGASGNTIVGDLVGLDITGLHALANQGAGINVLGGASGNTIGGTAAGARDVISGNVGSGVLIAGGAARNLVVGDLVGLGSDGSTAVANAIGVEIAGGATANTVGGTTAAGVATISGNAGAGVSIHDAGTSTNVVLGARIGTNAAGTLAAGNGGDGVLIDLGASGNRIGLAGVASPLISGNAAAGVEIRAAGTDSNAIAGAVIGLSLDRESALGDHGSGILIEGATRTTIGGTAAGAGVTIAGTLALAAATGSGISIGQGSSGTVILGDTIGGGPGFGNAAAGIVDPTDPVTIGGPAAGAANLIASNGAQGIFLGEAAAKLSLADRNQIFGNAGLGIAIDFTGDPAYPAGSYATAPTPNVPGGVLDAPVIARASIRAGVLTVAGFARPGAILEFYAAQAGGSGFGQGAVFLGSYVEGSGDDSDATTGGYSGTINGHNVGSDPTASPFRFTFAVPQGIAAGTLITAISTGTAAARSVSEFAGNATSDTGGGLIGPVVAAGGNATVFIGQTYAYRGTFGDSTTAKVSATVNYGDGTPAQVVTIDPFAPQSPSSDDYSTTATGAFELSHAYASLGQFTVVVTFNDSGGLSSSTSLVVTVKPAPPAVDDSMVHLAPASSPTQVSSPALVAVDQPVLLTGKFVDPTPGAVHTVSIYWGDGAPTLAVVDEVHHTFTATHAYTAPSKGIGSEGLYPVVVQVASSLNGAISTTGGLLYAQVADVPPTRLALTTGAASVAPGGSITLGGSFQAPTDPGDRYHVVVDWGDGSAPTRFDLVGLTSFSGLTHAFLPQPNYLAGTPYQIKVSVADVYEPLAAATATASIALKPATPSLAIATVATATGLAATTISEGGSITLSGNLVAAYPADAHYVAISWGDGTTSNVPLAAGATGFGSLTHAYPIASTSPRNKTAPAYQITATATDRARPADPAVTTAVALTVLDVAPAVSNLVVSDLRGNARASINENTTVVLTGRFTNPGGALDHDIVTINWGDGSTSTAAAADSLQGTFTASHQFGANPNLLPAFTPTITATATDREGMSGSAQVALTVNHLAPTASIRSGQFDPKTGQQVLTAPVVGGDAGSLKYQWTVDGSVVSTGSTYSLPASLMKVGGDVSHTVAVQVSDKYQAGPTFTARVDLVDDASPVYNVAAATSAVSEVLVSDLAGGKTVVGGQVALNADGSIRMAGGLPVTANLLAMPIVFDGVGAETFIGDSAGDVFNLHSDKAVAYGIGAGNTFVMTPNCTLTAVASSANNTLDFSTSTYGVTFNLAEADGTAQDVDPAAPKDHYVAINSLGNANAFNALVCSNDGDTITASTGSTITGGSGLDTVVLASVANVNINASGGGNLIQSSGQGVGGIAINGDAAPATAAGGAVKFLNSGSIGGPVNFYGDQGSTTFTNAAGGSTAGSVNFSGDQGSTTFNNSTGATSTGTISFGGDGGSSTFNNGGSISQGAIAFSGDGGSATFNNGAAAVGISGSGDGGSSTFGSSGATVATAVSFQGDGGSSSFNNGPGGVASGTISFGGDGGSATFNNGPVGGTGPINTAGDGGSGTLGGGSTTSTAQINFSGDGGTATFNNGGTASQSGTIAFGGDQGTATFNNGGTATQSGTIAFGGDGGSSTFNNGAGTTNSGTISFGGDGGSSTFNNGAGSTQAGSVSFQGDGGSATFNNGPTAIAISGAGDGGSTIFTTSPTGTVSYSGDGGSGSFGSGGATSSGTISFGGDGGSSTFNNGPGGVASGTISFGGDQGSATFNNGAGTTTTSVAGDGGSATLGNGNGSTAGTAQINFSGDGGTATFNNNAGATQAGTVSFAGDGGSATYNNGSAAGSATISYAGDGTSTTFNNGSTASTGAVSFSGDGGTATFNNNTGATQSGTISFGGDGGSGTLNPNPTTGPISTAGDNGSNTFNNGSGATSSGSINYGGDGNSNTFNNGSGATSTGSISYGGDGNSNTFNNGSGATQAGSISYGGDGNSSTYVNGASSTGPISYGGDGNAEEFWNRGSLASPLTLTGGSKAASTTLVNSGTVAGGITFVGGAGADALYNGAIINGVLQAGTVNGNVAFQGGPGAGVLVNDGAIAGSITFADGASTSGSSSTLNNIGTVGGSITFRGLGGADTLLDSGAVASGLIFDAGSGPNTLINSGAVGSIQFFGNPASAAGSTASTPQNQVLNQAGGLASIAFSGGAGGNLLVNQGNGVGSIGFAASGSGNELDNYGNDFGSIAFRGSTGGSILNNYGGATLPGSSPTIDDETLLGATGATDLLQNAGAGLASIKLAGTSGADQLVNIAGGVGAIRFAGGAAGGTLLNSGSAIASIVDAAGGGFEGLRNDGQAIGTIAFHGGTGLDEVLNYGSAAGLAYLGGSGADQVINAGTLGVATAAIPAPVVTLAGAGPVALLNAAGGTISGLNLVETGQGFTFENAGSLAGATIDASGAATGGLINDATGTLAGVTYKGSIAGDRVVSYGVLNKFTDVGGLGQGELDLYGPTNAGVTYQGGQTGDTLVIGTNAGNVSGITFIAGGGADLLASAAASVSGITFNGGSGTATFWNLGANASGLTLDVGSGAATLDNSGAGATGLLVRGDTGSGSATLYNSGNGFGTLGVIGGPGGATLTNTGSGTSASTICLTGGLGTVAPTNTLTNTGAGVGSIVLTDASGGTDGVVNSGAGVGSIAVTTATGVSSLINSGTGIGTILDTAGGGASSITNSGGVGSLTYNGGSGNASLVDSGNNGPSATIAFNGGGPNDTFVDSATAGIAGFGAGGGGSQVVIESGATGSIALTLGSGSNTVQFAGSPQASVAIQPPTGASTGVNTLDFSGYLGGGLTLDLMKPTAQAIAGGLSLTLGSPSEFTQVIGTRLSNTISGNTQADTLQTSSLPSQAASAAPAATPAATQWALLDFDTYADPVAGLATHAYTTAERQAILAAIQADYIGPDPTHPWFNVRITLNRSDIPASLLQSGSYATLYFNHTPPSGQPGGEASEVDFGNVDAGGYAAIQVNGLLGGDGQPANTSADFVTLSAKIGAHEFAHLLGVRHSDAFGPIGFGIHTPPGTSGFNPAYAAPNAAFETFDHLISSPATQGTDRFNDLRPLYFGPREAIKIAFGEQGTITPAAATAHASPSTAFAFPLAPLSVPNTDLSLPDIEQGMTLQVVAGAVSGAIGIDPTTGLATADYYTFGGHKGDVFTFETESQELPALAGGGSVDTIISVYDSSGHLVSYYGGTATNDDQFEGTDSLLDDVVLPADGTYTVKVSSYAPLPGDPRYDPSNPASPLYLGNSGSTLSPSSPDYDPVARAASIAVGQGRGTGSYDLFIYKANLVDPTAANTGNTLIARGSGSILAGSSTTDTLVGAAGTDTFRVGADTITLTSSSPAPTVDLQSSALFGLTIADTANQATWTATIDYGDGSPKGTAQVGGGQSLAISHLYSAPGTYTVTVSDSLGQGAVAMTVPVTVVETQGPSIAISSIPTGSTTTAAPASFGATLANPYLGTTYAATWTFTNQATGQVTTAAETVSAPAATPSLAFNLAQSFAAGTYGVALAVTNLYNGLATSATYPGTFTVVAQVATKVAATLQPFTYSGQAYAPPAGSVVVTDANNQVVANPSLRFTYSSGGATLANPPVDAGTYQLLVTYAGDATHLGSSSTTTFAITPATPTISLADAGGVYTGSAYAATASLSGVGSPPATLAGLVLTYSAGSTKLAGAPVDAGTYQVTASYAGSTDYAAASKTVGFAITPATPTISLADAGGVYTGSPFTATSALTGVGSPPAALSGLVLTYYASGSSAAIAAPTDAGSYQVMASYAGSTDYAAASKTVGFAITPATPTISLADAGGVYTGSAYAATASLSGVGSPPAALSGLALTYYAGSTKLAGAPVDAGSYQVTASYAGSTDYAAASKTVSFAINPAIPTLSLADAGGVYTGSAYAATASLTGVGSPPAALSGLVLTYYASGSSAAIAAPTDAGSYQVMASYAGSTDYAAATKTVSFAITADRTATTVASSAGSASPVYGGSVTFTATVANRDATVTPVGSVEFFDGTVDLGPGTAGPAANGSPTWTLSTMTLAAGSHAIAAAFTPKATNGVLDFGASDDKAAPLAQAVAAASTTTTASASSGSYGGSTTFTATVKAASPSTAIPAGAVDFADTTTGIDLGQGTLSASGVATFATASPLPIGTQSITVTYLGTANFNASSTTLTTSVSPSIYVLDPTASGSLYLSGSASITVPGLVQVNSTSTTAVQLSGNTRVNAGSIGIVGGSSVTGSSSFSVAPVKDSAAADPLANLPVPSATGMTTFAAVNLGGADSKTIAPGIYPSITVGGSGKLTMQAGIYVIAGGGFNVGGGASVTGSGVVLYNAGANYNKTGSSFGAFTLSSGTINLSPPTSGVYAGISVFQSRDNTQGLTIGGNVTAGLGGGAIYAKAATLSISGSARIGGSGVPVSPLIVDELNLTGAAQNNLVARPGAGGGATSVAGHLLDADVTVYVDTASGGFTAAELARVADAVASADRTVEAHGVRVSEVADRADATTVIAISPTSGSGDAASGILGSEGDGGITLVSGWDWYAGANPSAIRPGQYDFETIVLHEIGHALGLGHSPDASSVMYAVLDPGIAKRSLVAADLGVPDLDTGPCALHAAPASATVPAVRPIVHTRLVDAFLELLNPDPTPVGAGAGRATAPAHPFDAAIAAVADEPYLIPLPIAQEFAAQADDEATPPARRKAPMIFRV